MSDLELNGAVEIVWNGLQHTRVALKKADICKPRHSNIVAITSLRAVCKWVDHVDNNKRTVTADAAVSRETCRVDVVSVVVKWTGVVYPSIWHICRSHSIFSKVNSESNKRSK